MCDQSDVTYSDGDVVWVKLGPCWWPAEVVAVDKLPPDVMPSFRKAPLAVVKFFQEDTYEYVKNSNCIYMYNCSKKNEFINKGLYMYRTKHGHMDKFPEDVIRAETAVGGDIEILTRDEFQEVKKESYAGIFGDKRKTPGSSKKGVSKSKAAECSKKSTPTRKTNKEKNDYKVHILVQSSKTPIQSETSSSPKSAEPVSNEEKLFIHKKLPGLPENKSIEQTTPTAASSGIYSCHACPFSTSRLNVLILHSKNHSASVGFTPPPVQKKATPKQPRSLPPKSKTPKGKSLTENVKNAENTENFVRKKIPLKKRAAEEDPTNSESKKVKTDEEIKTSLLADWDDGEDESNDESSAACPPVSPKVPVASESPAEPVSAELAGSEMHQEKKEDSISEKAEPSSDSKYDFCEDEDWPVEADAGRKIPRVKNPRKDDTKSLSLDEDEVAKEVAELLSKTAVPELPVAPEPLKVEENFPEPSIVKSPDKRKYAIDEDKCEKHSADTSSTKAIFKTKTFFRSRHSRSQDIIGKYVAEQLAADRMDIVESELNGSESVSSPETRESPPVDQVKVARLAPKIQLKKMKAEAAQFKAADRKSPDMVLTDSKETYGIVTTDICTKIDKVDEVENSNLPIEKDVIKSVKNEISSQPLDVLYPTQEIKPINCEDTEKYTHSESVDHLVKEKKSNIDNKTEPLDNTDSMLQPDHYDTESTQTTASAVDALLSVSRDSDRVTKVISDDPPEDLFEEDKVSAGNSSLNGFCQNGVDEEIIVSTDSMEKLEYKHSNINGITEKLTSNSDIDVPESCGTISSSKFGSLEQTLLENKDTDSEKAEFRTTEPIEVKENIPSESDLQIAEALINMPGTALQTSNNDNENKLIDISETVITDDSQCIENEVCLENMEDEKTVHSETYDKSDMNMDIAEENIVDTTSNIAVRFETEQEKRDNLKAAQSLVQMSESLEHNLQNTDDNLQENESTSIDDNVASECVIEESKDHSINYVEQQVALLSSDNNCEVTSSSAATFETTSKLLQMLEEPQAPITSASKITKAEATTTTKLEGALGNERILNFDVAKSSLNKPQIGKQKIIIRRAPSNKAVISSLTEISSSDKIVLSKSKPTDGSCVQSYTIQATSEQVSTDASSILIQPTIIKMSKTPPKLTKIKPQKSIITPLNEIKSNNIITDDAMFDINSMPVVLSDDILTPESIERMPVVMSDANITITSEPTIPKVSKVIKSSKPTIIENEKIAISSSPVLKSEIKKTLLVNQEHAKVNTPNILSKSAKLRGTKPMLVIDKATGKQKIIMTKAEPLVKEVKQAPPTIIQPVTAAGKSEKFILLPSATSPRGGRTQKIVIDPQTGKAHVLVAKDGAGPGPVPVTAPPDGKPVSAKLLPSTVASMDSATPGSTVMIITNAHGAQSRIVLTPEHERILFPNKQQPAPQHQKKLTHRITTGPSAQQKSTIVTSTPAKATRIVPKQKSAIITSKGQLIVGGRVASGVASIAPRPTPTPPVRPIVSEKKVVPQKAAGEPLILLQQKSGAVVQLTPAQFEHLQRTGQLRAAVPPPGKQRARRPPPPLPQPPVKKTKHEVAIAPAPALLPVSPVTAPAPMVAPVPAPMPVPPLTPAPGPASAPAPAAPASSNYSELDNLEELLPVTTIQRSPAAGAASPPAAAAAATSALQDAQLLAVPGEHFGGPAGSFYLCVKEGGSLTPVDSRPLMLDNNQLVPMPERRDILEAALASSDVFRADGEAPDFRDLNANVSVHCRVSETSSTLNQPIMTPVELPRGAGRAAPASLEAGLAEIGVTPVAVPTSLELPITVTDPRLQPPAISMPLLTDDAAPPLPPPPPPAPL